MNITKRIRLKIYKYLKDQTIKNEKNNNSFGDWRLNIVFLEDYECRLRRFKEGVENERLKYYFIDALVDLLSSFNMTFEYSSCDTFTAKNGILIVGNPRKALTPQFIKELASNVDKGSALLVVGQGRMKPLVRKSLNDLISQWGVGFNSGVLMEEKKKMPVLTIFTGAFTNIIRELGYDEGCTLRLIETQNIAFIIKNNEKEIGGIGISPPNSGRIAIVGCYWPFTNHGSSGFRRFDNGEFVYYLFKWLEGQESRFDLDFKTKLKNFSEEYDKERLKRKTLKSRK